MAPPNLRSSDYYEILGCRKGDSDAELKKAYRKLAVKVSDFEKSIMHASSFLHRFDDVLIHRDFVNSSTLLYDRNEDMD